MTTTPAPTSVPCTVESSYEMNTLARKIARDGISAHSGALGRLADVVERTSLFPGVVSALRDDEAPAAMRARAFLVLVRHWDEIQSTAQRAAFDQLFNQLAAHWMSHQQLRSTGSINQLARSGTRLDELRSLTRAHAGCSG